LRVFRSLVLVGGFTVFRKALGHNPGHSGAAAELARRLYDVKQAGVFLGVSVWTVQELIWRGDLPHIRVGRLIRLDLRDLDSFITQNRTSEPA
jgi:excisionase family DNA binding protein